MTASVVPVNGSDCEWHSASPHDDNICQVVTGFFEAHGVFKHVQATVASTTEITAPNIGDAIIITSILMRARKRAGGGTVTLQFSDGVNTEVVFAADVTNDAVTLSFAPPGGWRAWKDAAMQVVTDQDFIVDITVGYAKVPTADEFAVWDAKR
jgi:hypothetical protein